MEQIMKNTAIVGAERKRFPDSPSSSSISSFGNLSESSLDSGSDSFDEVTSPSSSSADHPPANNDTVLDMSSLIQHLPSKRGLSKHYEGKSQSFTSLANVRSLEDLAKPESSYNKKLKIKSYRRSYGGGMMGETIDRGILKSSRVSCSSMNEKRASSNMEITSRPPTPPPHRSTSAATTISNQTPLFA